MLRVGILKTDPLVSVLMTSYNREKYIAFAIESVLASSYGKFELIIADDCSTDRTIEIAERYASSDPRVRVIRNERNLGDYPNRNEAARHATGKYLKYVDSDDYIYPWALEQFVSMIERFPEAGWGLCSTKPDLERPFPFVLSPAEAYRYHYKGGSIFDRAPLSSIIKKEAFDRVGGFAPIRNAGDFEMWHRLARQFPVVLMPPGLVWYRVHGEQESRLRNSDIREYESLRMAFLRDDACPMSAAEIESAIRDLRKRRLIWLAVELARFNRPKIVENCLALYYHFFWRRNGSIPKRAAARDSRSEL